MTPPAGSAALRIVPNDVELDSEQRIARLKREFGQRIVALVSTANITVTDVASCEAAVALRSTIGDVVKEIEKGFEDDKAYYWNKHKEVCAEENALIGQLLDPKNLRNPNTIDGKLFLAIQAFTAAEDQKRKDEEARLAEQLRKQDEERAANEAAALEQSGQRELAAAVINEQIAAPARTVVLPNVRREVQGLRTKRVWKWRFSGGPAPVKDILKETPPAVLERVMKMLPKEYCDPSVKTISAYVEAMKEKSAIPGITVYYEDVPVR
jgi:hypothetical protein